jgi:hypothetical protein
MFETLESRVQPGSMLTSGIGQLGGLFDLEGLMDNAASRSQELAVKIIQQGSTTTSEKSDELVIDNQAPNGDLGLSEGTIGIQSESGDDAKSYDGGDLSFIDLGAHVLGGNLYYSGDFDGRNGLANEQSTFVSDARIYDNFAVPASDFWFVGGVWSSNLMSARTFTANVEVRTGVSVGNGGTLVYSCTGGTADQYFTDAEGFGFIEFSVSVTTDGANCPSLTLGPGTYWLNVQPVGNGGGRSFQSSTSGANSVGGPVGDGNSFFDSTFFGYSFADVSTLLGTGPWDFSQGLFGGCVGSC